MVKKDTIKTIISIAVIIVLAIIITSVNNMVFSKSLGELETGARVESGVSEGGDGLNSNGDYSGCFSHSQDTVVFVYSNSCPYCNQMKPIVKELESEGYKFYWAEGSDKEAREIIDGCFSDLTGGYVPQVICPATGKEQTGAMDKSSLKRFADNCK